MLDVQVGPGFARNVERVLWFHAPVENSWVAIVSQVATMWTAHRDDNDPQMLGAMEKRGSQESRTGVWIDGIDALRG